MLRSDLGPGRSYGLGPDMEIMSTADSHYDDVRPEQLYPELRRCAEDTRQARLVMIDAEIQDLEQRLELLKKERDSQ